MDRGAWRAIYSPWGLKQSDTTEATKHAHNALNSILKTQIIGLTESTERRAFLDSFSFKISSFYHVMVYF